MMPISCHSSYQIYYRAMCYKSAVMPRQVVRPFVCDVEVQWSLILEYLEKNNLRFISRGRVFVVCGLQHHEPTPKGTPRNFGSLVWKSGYRGLRITLYRALNSTHRNLQRHHAVSLRQQNCLVVSYSYCILVSLM